MMLPRCSERLADTITTLTAENALLKANADEAESRALSQAFEIEQLKRQVVQLKVGVQVVEDGEAQGDDGLVDARADLAANGASFSIPISSDSSDSEIQPSSCLSVGLLRVETVHHTPSRSPVGSFSSEPLTVGTPLVEPSYPLSSSPDFLSPPPHDDTGNGLDHVSPLSSFSSNPSFHHPYHHDSPPFSPSYTTGSSSSSFDTASPYHDLPYTDHLRSLAESIIYRIEHQLPSTFQQPSSSSFEREPSSYTQAVESNLLGVNLGAGSAGSGFPYQDWEDGRGWDDALAMEGLKFAGRFSR
jgi:hypothetical protein